MKKLSFSIVLSCLSLSSYAFAGNVLYTLGSVSAVGLQIGDSKQPVVEITGKLFQSKDPSSYATTIANSPLTAGCQQLAKDFMANPKDYRFMQLEGSWNSSAELVLRRCYLSK